jgi:hypothetical protein
MTKKKTITSENIYCILRKYNIRLGPFSISDGGVVDVYGNVKISHNTLKKIPLQFGFVYGNFLCQSNLTTLKGCPQYVAGDFNCSGNQLTTLQHGPREVGGDFFAHDNLLTSLKGSPKHIAGNFNAFSNKLKTLEGSPERIEKNCYIYDNFELKSLKGAATYIGGSFKVTAIKLDDLRGCPQFIGNIFSFDADVKIDLGNQNCDVKSVIIQTQATIEPENYIPQIVLENQRYLSVVFKYFKYLDLFDETDGRLNVNNFNDVILDVKEGLR